MTETAFRRDVYLPELSTGSRLFLMAFRALAFGTPKCACLNKAFRTRFGEDGDQVLADIRALVCHISTAGRRRVKLAQPGCARLTHDEISLLSVLHAEQSDNTEMRDSHLQWLLGAGWSTVCLTLSCSLSRQFETSGLLIDIPACDTVEAMMEVEYARFGIVGRA